MAATSRRHRAATVAHTLWLRHPTAALSPRTAVQLQSCDGRGSEPPVQPLAANTGNDNALDATRAPQELFCKVVRAPSGVRGGALLCRRPFAKRAHFTRVLPISTNRMLKATASR